MLNFSLFNEPSTIVKLNLLQEIKGSSHHESQIYNNAKEIINRIKNEFDINNMSNQKINLVAEIKSLFKKNH